MTVRGFMVSDDFEGTAISDEALRREERAFRQANAHAWCGLCKGNSWAQRAFVWPRNGFSEFPLDFRPGVVQTVQGV